MALAALGVVYGDIGTSPLYTLRECFAGHHAITMSYNNIMGVLSLIFWALIIVVTLKYVFFIMRADNHGEGGILALLALSRSTGIKSNWLKGVLAVTGMFGASLFYGDGIITPAITVLSAVEGLNVVSPAFQHWSQLLAIAILIVLFMFQRKGTAKVGALFGPIMLMWFVTLAILGIVNIVKHPSVLAALNPWYAFLFFSEHGIGSMLIFGAVVLAVTGGEALYADMGHFGRKPIQMAWVSLVLPALVLNYYGQGALLLEDPEAINNPFYRLAPEWFLWPMLLLTTCATVIASQSVISGVFSVTRQAVQMGFWPRMQILHTSSKEIGQIYIPMVNWLVMTAVILLILEFRTSSNIAAAYGIAVTTAMMVDTILVCFVAHRLWRWPLPVVVLLGSTFFAVDALFLGPNILKIPDGGWFPLLVGAVVMLLMLTWRKGRRFLSEALGRESLPLKPFITGLVTDKPATVPGTAVFMTSSLDRVPQALLHNLKHNKVLHERVVFLTIGTQEIPFVPQGDRVHVEDLAPGFFVIRGSYGFQESPDVPRLLEQCEPFGLTFDMMDTTFFLSREHLIPSKDPGMPSILDKIFAVMTRNAVPATSFFKIPPNRVVEMGTQIEI
ncbi:MAG: potassium transporter Kup [Pseudomonadales bacterium]|nr:potassium transporter Kup [Pseudomonadales bacterium]